MNKSLLWLFRELGFARRNACLKSFRFEKRNIESYVGNFAKPIFFLFSVGHVIWWWSLFSTLYLPDFLSIISRFFASYILKVVRLTSLESYSSCIKIIKMVIVGNRTEIVSTTRFEWKIENSKSNVQSNESVNLPDGRKLWVLNKFTPKFTIKKTFLKILFSGFWSFVTLNQTLINDDLQIRISDLSHLPTQLIRFQFETSNRERALEWATMEFTRVLTKISSDQLILFFVQTLALVLTTVSSFYTLKLKLRSNIRCQILGALR